MKKRRRPPKDLGSAQALPAAPPERLLAAKEMAHVLGVNPGTLRRWVLEGRAPAMRLADRSIRFDRVRVISALTTPVAVKKPE